MSSLEEGCPTYRDLFLLEIVEKIEEVVRVDHAGEYGAKMIYLGQLDSLAKSTPDGSSDAQILEMLEGELVHLGFFEKESMEWGVHHTLFSKVWHVGGYLLGYIPAYLFGKDGAMIVTLAVEGVIEGHYLEQYNDLERIGFTCSTLPEDRLTGLKSNILRFREEEMEHAVAGRVYGERFGASELGAESATLYGLTRFFTKVAIAISKKI